MLNDASVQVDFAVNRFFEVAIERKASNLHIKVGQPPMLRVNGRLEPLADQRLSSEEMVQLCIPLLDDRHRGIFEREGGTDFAHIVPYQSVNYRFRVNLYQQLGSLALAAQAVEPHVPTLDELYLPPILEQFCHFDQGMILLCGMTGTGKTTTIAAMLNWINHHYRKHILTIEDPIEYIFADRQSLINQREIGDSVKDFSIAMKHAVREDPDIILVGEMRDAESFATALHAAETGHLVFGTVHASSAATCVGRILDLFPQEMHQALRSSICFNMKAIVAQKLLRTVVESPRRVPIVEILTLTPTVRKLILEGEDAKLPDAIRIGTPEGMQTFDDSLYHFVKRGFLDHSTALDASQNPNAFKMRMKGVQVKSSGLL